jgi:hypothetical protein
VLLGAEGGSVRQRLRLPEDATEAEVRASTADQLMLLRRLSESPFAEPATKRAAQALRRTCEGLLTDPGAEARSSSPVSPLST